MGLIPSIINYLIKHAYNHSQIFNQSHLSPDGIEVKLVDVSFELLVILTCDLHAFLELVRPLLHGLGLHLDDLNFVLLRKFGLLQLVHPV